MAPVIEAAYQPRKVGMLAAGFDVEHAHIHVLPLYESHDITSKVILEGRRANPSEKELRMAAQGDRIILTRLPFLSHSVCFTALTKTLHERRRA